MGCYRQPDSFVYLIFVDVFLVEGGDCDMKSKYRKPVFFQAHGPNRGFGGANRRRKEINLEFYQFDFMHENEMDRKGFRGNKSTHL